MTAPERVPAGLDHDVGVEAGDERGSHRDGELGAPELDLGRGALPHPRVDEHPVPERCQQRPELADVHRDRLTLGERERDLLHRVGADRPHAVELRLPVEGGVGERHPAPRGRGPRLIVEGHAVALAEQEVGDGRADVADATDDHDRHGGSLGQAAGRRHLASRSRLRQPERGGAGPMHPRLDGMPGPSGMYATYLFLKPGMGRMEHPKRPTPRR